MTRLPTRTAEISPRWRAADESIDYDAVAPVPAITVVVSTYNRAQRLAETLRGVLDQDARGVRYEVLVVDNNSTDQTSAVVAAARRPDGVEVRYLFEPRQGIGFARNTGIEHARAPIIAFLDDDLDVPRDWLRCLLRTFREHPDAMCAVGRILPDWEAMPPPWLTERHWSPLAIMDFGDADFAVDRNRPICLMGGNLTCRRELFERLGGFNPDFTRSEDHELTNRVVAAGIKAIYAPWITIRSRIEPARMSKRYHRRWHYQNGTWRALLNEPAERSSRFRVLGVPGYIVRENLLDALPALATAMLRGRLDDAFTHEVRIWHFAGFCVGRWFGRGRRRLIGTRGTRVWTSPIGP